MASRAPAVKQRRREEIVDVATALLGEQGYGLTTMDDIATASRVTKRTLYRYVAAKQDILPMIHERFLRAAEELMSIHVEEDPIRQVSTFIKSFVTVVVEHQSAVQVFFGEEHNLSVEAKSSIIERRDAFERGFRELVRAGQEAGEFRPISIDIVSFAVFGAVGSTYLWHSPGGTFGIDEISQLMSEILLGGLVEAEPRPSEENQSQDRPVSHAAPEAVTEAARIPASVLDTAARLFAARGYQETNTREIAESAGVTKSGLFYHIGSKEDLLYALNLKFALGRLDHLHQIEEDLGLDAVTRLRRLIIDHSRIMEGESDLVRISLDQRRYLTGEKGERVDMLHRRYVHGFENAIQRGIDAGIMKPVHAHLTALVLLGMVNWMARWYRPGGRLTAEQIGEVFADLVLHGLRKSRPVQDE